MEKNPEKFEKRRIERLLWLVEFNPSHLILCLWPYHIILSVSIFLILVRIFPMLWTTPNKKQNSWEKLRAFLGSLEFLFKSLIFFLYHWRILIRMLIRMWRILIRMWRILIRMWRILIRMWRILIRMWRILQNVKNSWKFLRILKTWNLLCKNLS